MLTASEAMHTHLIEVPGSCDLLNTPALILDVAALSPAPLQSGAAAVSVYRFMSGGTWSNHVA